LTVRCCRCRGTAAAREAARRRASVPGRPHPRGVPAGADGAGSGRPGVRGRGRCLTERDNRVSAHVTRLIPSPPTADYLPATRVPNSRFAT